MKMSQEFISAIPKVKDKIRININFKTKQKILNTYSTKSLK